MNFNIFQRISKNFKSKSSAFTLVEVLVSVAVFVMIIIALSQVYIAVIRSERVAYALLNSENNIRVSLETIARSVRVGKKFELSPDGKKICFDYYLEGTWQNSCYRFNSDSDTLEKSSSDGPYMSILDPELKVNYGRFYIKGGTLESQPVIIIVLEVSTNVRKQDYFFNLETAITPRYLGEES